MLEQEATAQVVVDEDTTSDHIEALQQHLDAHGIGGSIEASYPSDARESLSVGLTHHEPGIEGRYGSGDEAWTVLIHTRINALARQCEPNEFRAFVDGLRALRAEQTGSSPADGLVFLVDETTGVRFDLEYQLPLQAYADLEGIRISTFNADPVQFHRKSGPHGRWRSPH